MHGEGRELISSFHMMGHCPRNTQCMVWPFPTVLAPAFRWLTSGTHVQVVMVASWEVSWVVEGEM